MKRLENLLQRYNEGVITPEEKAELDLLTHRDEIFQAATVQATKIRRKRYITASSIASLAIVAGVFFTIFNTTNPNPDSSTVVAQADIHETPMHSETITAPLPATESTTQPSAQHQPVEQPTPTQKQAIRPVETTPREPIAKKIESLSNNTEPLSVTDPVVACNTQCSPDSVINDIWNFLKA